MLPKKQPDFNVTDIDGFGVTPFDDEERPPVF